MRRRRMAAITYDPTLTLQFNKQQPKQHRVLLEEIEGLIKVYKDGHVERPPVVPNVTTTLPPDLGVTSNDVIIDKFTNIWARYYVPVTNCKGITKLPLLIYFHGGGFCVGSASWSCYHEFLAKLAGKANCVVLSVNYRLAPENPLPAAYDDGVKTVMWLREKAISGGANEWWLTKVNFSNIFLAGDSAGGNIAHNVALRAFSKIAHNLTLRDFSKVALKGTILIQPFFGGESRTCSEKHTVQSPRSALTLTSADTYWQLSLPAGANRDHPWCNPAPTGVDFPDKVLVCVSELDILKDRNLEFCDVLKRGGKKVECFMYKGVGHAFQVLNKSQVAQARTAELISHIKSFISG